MGHLRTQVVAAVEQCGHVRLGQEHPGIGRQRHAQRAASTASHAARWHQASPVRRDSARSVQLYEAKRRRQQRNDPVDRGQRRAFVQPRELATRPMKPRKANAASQWKPASA